MAASQKHEEPQALTGSAPAGGVAAIGTDTAGSLLAQSSPLEILRGEGGCDSLPYALSSIRNVCILAHVDHGKTSLSDRLLAANGLISNSSAAKIRFLDSRADEQQRQITIKSSVVSLLFDRRKDLPCVLERPASAVQSSCVGQGGEGRRPADFPSTESEGDAAARERTEAGGDSGRISEKLILNLIDCPGHVDFASEVSAGVRLSDGCLLLVDIVEGVGPQTLAALRSALRERVVPVLAITKVDKAIAVLKMSTTEFVSKCNAIIQQLNAHLHQQLLWEGMCQQAGDENRTETQPSASKENAERFSLNPRSSVPPEGDPDGNLFYFDENETQNLEFCPSKGNVVFLSSLHNWCLHLPTFARRHLLSLLGIPVEGLGKLCAVLWGEFYLKRTKQTNARDAGEANSEGATAASSPKSKTKTKASTELLVRKTPFFAGQKSLVEQLVLLPIWQVYEASKPPTSTESHDASSTTTESGYDASRAEKLSKMILSLKLPNGEAAEAEEILARRIPHPLAAAEQRLRHLCPLIEHVFTRAKEEVGAVEDAGRDGRDGRESVSELCAPDGQPLVLVYVAKFLAADLKRRRLTGDVLQGNETSDGFVCLSRVFFGTLKKNARLFVCGGRRSTRPFFQNTSSSLSAEEECVYRVCEVYILIGQDLRAVREAPQGAVVALQIEAETKETDCPFEALGFAEGNQEWLSSTGKHEASEEASGESEGRAAVSSSTLRCLSLSSWRDCPALLSAYDEVSVLSSGEIVLGCCGEVHLGTAVKDLETVFARVPLRVSPPMAAIRETLAFVSAKTELPALPPPASGGRCSPFPPWNPPPPASHPAGGERLEWLRSLVGGGNAVVVGETADKLVAFVLKAERMPDRVTNWLSENAADIVALLKTRSPTSRFKTSETSRPDSSARRSSVLAECFENLERELAKVWNDANAEKLQNDSRTFPSLWGLAVSGGAANVLVSSLNFRVFVHSTAPEGSEDASARGSDSGGNFGAQAKSAAEAVSRVPSEWREVLQKSRFSLAEAQGMGLSESTPLSGLLAAFVSGFELASLAGPLAEEPIRGVVFTLEALACSSSRLDPVSDASFPSGSTGGASLQGQAISAMREACRSALLQRGRCRIFEAMLRFTLSVEQRVIGKVHAALSRRRARVSAEDVPEGHTSLFVISGYLPKVNADGFVEEIRSKASGHASLSLQFSHWNVIDEDPFPEACMTETELEDEGEAGLAALSSQIVSRAIINSIRKSKGLPTEERVVVAAEKQRTLSRNK